MAPFIAFPQAPVLQDGMTVSSASINAHNQGLLYVLGASHCPTPASAWHAQTDIYQSDYVTACEFWLYQPTFNIHYLALVSNDSAGKTAYWRLQALDKNSAWQTMIEENGVWDVYTVRENDLDVDALHSGLFPIDKMYRWRFQVKTSDESYHTKIQAWGVFCREAIAGWQAPHDFGAEVSAASHFNDIRTDLNLLRDQLPTAVPFTNSLNTGTTYDDNDEHTFVKGVYRYRPNSLYGAIKLRFSGTGSNFRLFINLSDTAGNTAKVYESGNIASKDADQLVDATVDLTAGAAAAALTAAGIALTLGNYYAISAGIERQDGSVSYKLLRTVLAKVSDGVPHGTWAEPNEWAEGDTDFGPTHLDKFKTDLEMFYIGGDEVMFGETPPCMYTYIGQATYNFGGIHRKRWLAYHPRSGKTPAIEYGDDYDESYELSTESGWQHFDLAQLTIPWGGYYIVYGVEGCFETDSVYED